MLNIGVFASTQMNDHSSRSHVIFTVTIEQSDIGADKKQHVRMGKLHLVDLAVSNYELVINRPHEVEPWLRHGPYKC